MGNHTEAIMTACNGDGPLALAYFQKRVKELLRNRPVQEKHPMLWVMILFLGLLVVSLFISYELGLAKKWPFLATVLVSFLIGVFWRRERHREVSRWRNHEIHLAYDICDSGVLAGLAKAALLSSIFGHGHKAELRVSKLSRHADDPKSFLEIVNANLKHPERNENFHADLANLVNSFVQIMRNGGKVSVDIQRKWESLGSGTPLVELICLLAELLNRVSFTGARQSLDIVAMAHALGLSVVDIQNGVMSQGTMPLAQTMDPQLSQPADLDSAPERYTLPGALSSIKDSALAPVESPDNVVNINGRR